MSVVVLAVVGGLALSTVSGAMLVAALAPGFWRNESWLVRGALGWGVGSSITSMIVFALGMAGVPLGWGSVSAVLIAVAGLSAMRLAGRQGELLSRNGEVAVQAAEVGAGSRAGGRLCWGLLALIVAVAVVTAMLSVEARALSADAHGIWLLKARVVFLDGGFDGIYWQDWPDGHDRRCYPPLVSLLGTWAHLLGGGVDDAAAKLIFVLFHGCLLVLIHASLARRVARMDAVLATLAFSVSVQTVMLTIWGVADLPLAFFVLASVYVLSDRNAPAPALAGLLLAGMAFTKLEGIPAAVVVAIMATLLSAPERRWRRLLRLLVPALVITGCWLFFLHERGIPVLVGPKADFPPDMAALGGRLSTVAGGFLTRAVDPGWLFVWPFFLLAVARESKRRLRRDLVLWGLVVIALLGLYAVAYAVQAVDSEWLVATTMNRLMYHVFPMAFLFTVVAFSAPAGPRATADRPEPR